MNFPNTLLVVIFRYLFRTTPCNFQMLLPFLLSVVLQIFHNQLYQHSDSQLNQKSRVILSHYSQSSLAVHQSSLWSCVKRRPLSYTKVSVLPLPSLLSHTKDCSVKPKRSAAFAQLQGVLSRSSPFSKQTHFFLSSIHSFGLSSQNIMYLPSTAQHLKHFT